MTADETEAEVLRCGLSPFERERRIKALGEELAWCLCRVQEHRAAANEYAQKARDKASLIRDLIATRTPAEVEQMERERGLR